MSQQFQRPRNLINHALRRRPNPQHRVAPTRDLRASRVGNDLRYQPQAERRSLQCRQLILALHLQRDLGLALPLPAPEDRGFRVVLQEVLVAG